MDVAVVVTNSIRPEGVHVLLGQWIAGFASLGRREAGGWSRRGVVGSIIPQVEKSERKK